MSDTHLFSSVPVVAVALLLFFSTLLHDPATLRPGPAFWPAMRIAAVAVAAPVTQMAAPYGRQSLEMQRDRRALAGAGALGFIGAEAGQANA